MPNDTPVLVIERRSLPGGAMFKRQTRIREAEPGESVRPYDLAPEGDQVHDWTDDEEQF